MIYRRKDESAVYAAGARELVDRRGCGDGHLVGPVLAQRIEGPDERVGEAHRGVRRRRVPKGPLAAALSHQETAGPEEAGPTAARHPPGRWNPPIRRSRSDTGESGSGG